MEELKLAPGLLLSMPQLADPNFSRAVVLMLEHNDESSFGLVMNHESDTTVEELLESSLDMSWGGSSEAMVWSGGPVTPSSGWVMHSGCDALAPARASLDEALDTTGTVEVVPGLFLSTSEDNLRVLAANPPEKMRLLLGYSGWSKGQLAQEMTQGSWLHAGIQLSILFDTPAETMWEKCLQNMGIEPETLVQSFGVH